jgi:hypothetical protein
MADKARYWQKNMGFFFIDPMYFIFHYEFSWNSYFALNCTYTKQFDKIKYIDISFL